MAKEPTLEELLAERARREIAKAKESRTAREPMQSVDAIENLRRGMGTQKYDADPRSFKEKIAEYGPQAGAATAGSVLLPMAINAIPGMQILPEEGVTIPLGAKLGALAARIAGSSAGGVIGRGTQQGIRALAGSEKAPKNLGEFWRDIRDAAVEEGFAELVGEGIWAGGRKLGAIGGLSKSRVIPRSASLSDELAEASQRISSSISDELPPGIRKKLHSQTLFPRRKTLMGQPTGPWYKPSSYARKPVGAIITPAQRTVSPALDWIESAMEGAAFGGNRLYDVKNVLNTNAYKQYVQEMSDRLWLEAGERMTPTEVGVMALESMKRNRQIADELVRGAYFKADQMSGGRLVNTMVDMRPVKHLANEIVEEASKYGDVGSAEQLRIFGEHIKGMADDMNVWQAHEARSFVLEEGRKLDQALGKKSRRLSKAITEIKGGEGIDSPKSIFNQMETAVKEQLDDGDSVWRLLREADIQVAENARLFDDATIKSLAEVAKRNPEKMAGKLFDQGGLQTILKARNVLDNESFNALRASWFHDKMLRYAKDDIEGRMFSPAFERQFNAYGDENLRAMFGDELLNDIRKVMKMGRMVEGKSGRGGGSMVMQLTQAGALISAALGKIDETEAGLILLGPMAMSRLMTSRIGAKLIAEGLTRPATSRTAVVLATRIVNIAGGGNDTIMRTQLQLMEADRMRGSGAADL